MDNEPADALASRLLKAFFDGPGREMAQGTLPLDETARAISPSDEAHPAPNGQARA